LRTQAVQQARTRAQEQVKQARVAMEEDKQQAMAKLQSDAARLATDIVRTVMRPMASPSQGRWPMKMKRTPLIETGFGKGTTSVVPLMPLNKGRPQPLGPNAVGPSSSRSSC